MNKNVLYAMLCFLPLLVACKKDQVQEEQNAVNFTAVIVPMGSEDDGSRVCLMTHGPGCQTEESQ